MVKTTLRITTLILCAIIGLWAVGHGFVLAARVNALTHEGIRQSLVEISLSIAGGVLRSLRGGGTAQLLANPP